MSVPIVDGAGLLVERRLLCLSLKGPSLTETTTLVNTDAFRTWVADRFAKRLEVLRRRATSDLAARMEVDEAIARHLVTLGWPPELQAGLFDRRDERAFLTARDETFALEQQALTDRRNRELAVDLGVAAPAVELVFSW